MAVGSIGLNSNLALCNGRVGINEFPLKRPFEGNLRRGKTAVTNKK
jgi:hypothetical protein